MYGYLKPSTKLLSIEELKKYKKYYCSNCIALGKNFGYKYRMLNSFDIAFLNILTSSQCNKKCNTTKSSCALFPIKREVFDYNHSIQIFSSSISVLLLQAKLTDSINDNNSRLSKYVQCLLKQTFLKAAINIQQNNFSINHFKELTNNQNLAESSDTHDFYTFYNPTAFFTSQLLEHSALLSNNNLNKETLSKIGYNIGKIIYLVDSCIDFIDDIDKKQFNSIAKLSVNNDLKTTSLFLVNEITLSLKEIEILTSKLILHSNKELINNILTIGFPLEIMRRIKLNINVNKKKKILKKLPHAAIITALFTIIPKNAYSLALTWGDALADPTGHSDNFISYGLTICGDKHPHNYDTCGMCCTEIGLWVECLCNPCVYFDTWTSHSLNFCGGILQIPKALLSLGLVYTKISNSENKALKRTYHFERSGDIYYHSTDKIGAYYFNRKSKRINSIDNLKNKNFHGVSFFGGSSSIIGSIDNDYNIREKGFAKSGKIIARIDDSSGNVYKRGLFGDSNMIANIGKDGLVRERGLFGDGRAIAGIDENGNLREKDMFGLGKIIAKPSSSAEGCVLSTACIKAKNLSDDCYELRTLRAFRDNFVKNWPRGKEILIEYYTTAPFIINKINKHRNKDIIWDEIYNKLVVKSVELINKNDNYNAFINYSNIYNELKRKCLGIK